MDRWIKVLKHWIGGLRCSNGGYVDKGAQNVDRWIKVLKRWIGGLKCSKGRYVD